MVDEDKVGPVDKEGPVDKGGPADKEGHRVLTLSTHYRVSTIINRCLNRCLDEEEVQNVILW